MEIQNSKDKGSNLDEDYDFPKNNQHKQRDWSWWVKFVLDIFTFIGAALIVWFTYNTLQEVRLQTPAIITATNTSNRNLEISQRAYLRAEFPQYSLDKMVKIPIINYGNIPCKTISTNITCIIFKIKPNQPKHVFLPENRINVFIKKYFIVTHSDIITPNSNSDYSIYIELPVNDKLINDIKAGRKQLSIMGNMKYDTGFNHVDSVSICFTYNHINNIWVRCGDGPVINFSQTNLNK